MGCRFASRKRVTIKTGRVFLANRGRARYQVRAFRAVARRRVRSAAIAQLVEHVIRNDGVTGSSPVCGTSNFKDLSLSRGNKLRRFPARWIYRVSIISTRLLSQPMDGG